MFVTIRIRNLVAFAAGLAVAVVAAFVFQAWRAEAVGSDDSAFVPVAPCRLFDYRPAPDTVGDRTSPLGPGEVHRQQVTGKIGDCNVPTGVSGVAMNVTAVGGTKTSYLTVYPANLTAPPLASNLNWVAGSPPTPNKVDVKLAPSGAIRLFNETGNVYVLADVIGYYANDAFVDLQRQLHSINSGSSVIPSGVTVTGYELIDQSVNGATADDVVAFKFPARAPVDLTYNKVNFADGTPGGQDNDPTCTGSVDVPTAPAGKVCLYVDFSGGVERLAGEALYRQSDTGFGVQFFTPSGATHGADQFIWFSWAYRAP